MVRVLPAPDQRWLLAYGLHQFAGLQILLHVFAAGATLVAPAPRRPREGLAAMRAHGVSHASATPNGRISNVLSVATPAVNQVICQASADIARVSHNRPAGGHDM